MKTPRKMSYVGIGPIYVTAIVSLTIIGLHLSTYGFIPLGKIDAIKTPCTLTGVVFILFGIFLWIQAAIVSNIDRNIKNNRLVTTGVYRYVRNPIYSAFAIALTGVLLIEGNLFLLILPFIFWALMSLLVKREETTLEDLFGEEYNTYKKTVNRCIPWLPRK